MSLSIRPVTPGDRADFIQLFGPQGGCYGCWCSYLRMPAKQRNALSASERRDAMLARIDAGPPPGLMAWDAETPVGWMQIGPRADVSQFNNPRRASTPLPDGPADDPTVWAISCFFAAKAWRGRGITAQLIDAGIVWARENGARMIEAAPIDHAKQSQSVGLFTGPSAVFARAGFVTVARQKPGRPLVRLLL